MTTPTPAATIEEQRHNVLTKQKVTSVPDAWDDLSSIPGASTGHDIVPLTKNRIMLVGRGGSGKSTLINSDSRIAILDLEKGGRTVRQPRAIRFSPPPTTPFVHRAQYCRDVVKKLVTRKKSGKDDIQMLGIDTIDSLIHAFALEMMNREKITDPGDYGGGHGKGYAVLRNDIMDNILGPVTQAGMGWVIICHITPIKIRAGEGDKLVNELSMSQSFRGAFFKECDHFLAMENTKVVDKKSRQAVTAKQILCTPGGTWANGAIPDVKVRVPIKARIVLPINDPFAALEKEYNLACEKLVEEYDDSSTSSTGSTDEG